MGTIARDSNGNWIVITDLGQRIPASDILGFSSLGLDPTSKDFHMYNVVTNVCDYASSLCTTSNAVDALRGGGATPTPIPLVTAPELTAQAWTATTPLSLLEVHVFPRA